MTKRSKGGSMLTAAGVIEQLESLATPEELPKVRKRLREGEAAFGVRMRDLFDTGKAYTALDMEQLDQLLDHAAYEPRMAAFCILDFKARRKGMLKVRLTPGLLWSVDRGGRGWQSCEEVFR